LWQFYCQCTNKSEVERIQYAKELGTVWEKKKCRSELFPGIRASNDYWYLVQLFALDRHDTGRELINPRSFFKAAKFYLVDDAMDVFDTIANTRQSLDAYLANNQSEILSRLHLPPQYVVRLIRYDEYLRLENLHPSYIEGVWKSPENGDLGLFGGISEFGGRQHIDALWNDMPLRRLHLYLVATEKTHDTD
jgi:hypothetical protein